MKTSEDSITCKNCHGDEEVGSDKLCDFCRREEPDQGGEK